MATATTASRPVGAGAERWVVCQIGAREHYAAARALHRAGRLAALVTDAWVKPGAALGQLSPGLAGRFHPGLDGAHVLAPRLGAVPRELTLRARHRGGWPLVMARNRWFQRMAVKQLARCRMRPLTIFAYSYAAREIFAYARSRGWRTVLGQIDPGPAEERIVADLHRRSALKADWHPAPSQYWDEWRAECDLADTIVVNSAWSRDCLLGEGVPTSKLAVVPLALEAPPAAQSFSRAYPSALRRRTSDACPVPRPNQSQEGRGGAVRCDPARRRRTDRVLVRRSPPGRSSAGFEQFITHPLVRSSRRGAGPMNSIAMPTSSCCRHSRMASG